MSNSFVTPWTAALQAPLSMGFSRQEHWSGLPHPPPGDLSNSGIKPLSLMSPALAERFFITSTMSNFTFTFHFHALEKEMATHSGVLAWRIPGTVEPGGLPSMASHRVRNNWSVLAAAEARVSTVKVKLQPHQELKGEDLVPLTAYDRESRRKWLDHQLNVWWVSKSIFLEFKVSNAPPTSFSLYLYNYKKPQHFNAEN